MNTGKLFEQQFTKSVPEDVLVYRIPDQAQSFCKSSLRFSIKNPFDYIIWNPNTKTLYALELKTVKGKSISFERAKDDSGEIHYHQIEGLKLWDSYGGIISGFVIEFRELEKTIFISIKDFIHMLDVVNKKSFNINDLDKNEIKYYVIEQEKKRTRFTYCVDRFLNDMRCQN